MCLNDTFFSMLVNIYGSRDLFVSEYRTLLADRILSSFNYDIAKEVSFLKMPRAKGCECLDV